MSSSADQLATPDWIRRRSWRRRGGDGRARDRRRPRRRPSDRRRIRHAPRSYRAGCKTAPALLAGLSRDTLPCAAMGRGVRSASAAIARSARVVERGARVGRRRGRALRRGPRRHSRRRRLVVVDRATRQAAGDGLRARSRAPVVIVGDDLDDDGLIAADARGAGQPPGRRSRATAISASPRRSWCRATCSASRSTSPPAPRSASARSPRDADKRAAIGEVCAWAEAIGARRPIVHRLASVVDELLMNALYDAPRESGRAARPRRAALGVPTTARSRSRSATGSARCASAT